MEILRYWKLLVVGVIVCILTVAGALALQKAATNTKSLTENGVTSTSGVRPTPAVEGTDNWRDYKDLDFNYAIRHPAGWIVNRVLPSTEDILTQTVLSQTPLGSTDSAQLGGGGAIILSVIDNPNSLSVHQIIDKEAAKYPPGAEVKRVQVFRFNVPAIAVSGLGSGTARDFFIIKGLWAYRIRMEGVDSTQKQELFDKIIATLNFI